MTFHLDTFRRQYAKPYLTGIKIVAAGAAVAAALTVLCLLLEVQLPAGVALLLVGIVAAAVFPVLPLQWAFYSSAKRAAKRQRQWYEGGQLHVLLVPRSGFDWGAVVHQTQHYIVLEQRKLWLSTRYIHIQGTIRYQESDNGIVRERMVSSCQIPRTFSNEQMILQKRG